MNVYELSYSWYEEYSPKHFLAPVGFECETPEEWQAYCDKLLPQAVETAIKNQESRDYPCWVGWSEIVDAMQGILLENGFTPFKPIKAGYWGSCILDREDRDMGELSTSERQKLIAFNKKVRERDEIEDAEEAAGK